MKPMKPRKPRNFEARTTARSFLGFLGFLGFWLPALAQVSAGCYCDVAKPETMEARQCSLCKEAEKQPPDVKFFFLKDANPMKANRTADPAAAAQARAACAFRVHSARTRRALDRRHRKGEIAVGR